MTSNAVEILPTEASRLCSQLPRIREFGVCACTQTHLKFPRILTDKSPHISRQYYQQGGSSVYETLQISLLMMGFILSHQPLRGTEVWAHSDSELGTSSGQDRALLCPQNSGHQDEHICSVCSIFYVTQYKCTHSQPHEYISVSKRFHQFLGVFNNFSTILGQEVLHF